jgi:hypothetical protein
MGLPTRHPVFGRGSGIVSPGGLCSPSPGAAGVPCHSLDFQRRYQIFKFIHVEPTRSSAAVRVSSQLSGGGGFDRVYALRGPRLTIKGEDAATQDRSGISGTPRGSNESSVPPPMPNPRAEPACRTLVPNPGAGISIIDTAHVVCARLLPKSFPHAVIAF